MAAALYVGGAFICVFAGDYLTLFIGWELMSVSSTFLVWLRREPAATRAGIRYFLFHTLGGLFLLAGLLLRYHATGSLAFEAVDPAAARFYDYLILTASASTRRWCPSMPGCPTPTRGHRHRRGLHERLHHQRPRSTCWPGASRASSSWGSWAPS